LFGTVSLSSRYHALRFHCDLHQKGNRIHQNSKRAQPQSTVLSLCGRHLRHLTLGECSSPPFIACCCEHASSLLIKLEQREDLRVRSQLEHHLPKWLLQRMLHRFWSSSFMMVTSLLMCMGIFKLTTTVANLPAEITHLYEEMQAKDQQIQDLRAAIQQRDNSLQKFIKLNGSLVQNPKEEPYSKTILQNYERAQVLQEEKIGLSEKAAALVSSTVTTRDKTWLTHGRWTDMSSD
jgi:hypothetical protein